MLHSPDSNTREWGKQQRDAFNKLRNAKDPELRQYYQETIRRSLQEAKRTLQYTAMENMQGYLLGKEGKVKIRKYKINPFTIKLVSTIQCGMFSFTISKYFELNLVNGQDVFIKFYLEDNEHPQKYAVKALPSDPANRLAISVSGQDSRGTFHIWLVNKKGEKAVKKINTLVDMLNGYTYDERREFLRRWIVEKPLGGGGPRRIIYT